MEAGIRIERSLKRFGSKKCKDGSAAFLLRRINVVANDGGRRQQLKCELEGGRYA